MINTFEDFNSFLNYFEIEQILLSPNFEEAITHSSISKKHNYERLEFLGDTILNFCISKMLFETFTNLQEGELSKKKSYLISRKVCRVVAYSIGLDAKIKFLNNHTINIDDILADTLESLICVIYQTYNIEKVYDIIHTLFFQYINNEEIENPKMKLQEYTQKHFNCLPEYQVIKKEGTENEPIFTIEVCIDTSKKQYKEIGIGKNKKSAEIDGAKKMIKLLNIKK